METIFVADATALMEIPNLIPDDQRAAAFDDLTSLVEKKRLRFPRKVVDDMLVRARAEQITSWCQGQGNKLRPFKPDYEHQAWLMRKIQIELGFDTGIENLDGTEPSIVHVASYVRQLVVATCTVKVVSEDIGDNPFRPTMSALCDHFGWHRTSALAFLGEVSIIS